MGRVKSFLHYWKKSQTVNDIQDQYVRQCLKESLDDDRYYYTFGLLDSLRRRLSFNNTTLTIQDLGAGSKVHQSNQRTVKDILKTSVSPNWKSEFLFKLIHHLQPQTKLELGTCLGLTTLYQYMPNTQAQFYTLEGCPNLADFAQTQFNNYKAQDIKVLIGDFAETLPQALAQLKRLDYAFLDGNHQKQPTLDYFSQCLPYCHKNTVLVFDDIHWSDEMQQAWTAIKQHERVQTSVDLYYLGLIFLNPTTNKQHYTIIPNKYKPWKK